MSEDCPICCNELTEADLAFPLFCPTPTCHFNFCAECISSLQKSASDGYQVASDGSRQVRVHVQCPQCRAKYCAPQGNGAAATTTIVAAATHVLLQSNSQDSSSNGSTGGGSGGARSTSRSSQAVVSAVLQLRRAVTILPLLKQQDSQLSARQLQEKFAFVHTQSFHDLQQASKILTEYHKAIDKHVDTMVISEEHKKTWKTFLPEKLDPQDIPEKVYPDPTLYFGWQDLLSRDEQEFVTKQLTNGNVEGLVQAANILLSVSQLPVNSSWTVQHLAFASDAEVMDPEKLYKLRQRFPLPGRMPRCVSLPAYDPTNKSSKLLRFQSNSTQPKLKVVRGVAGRMGLRPGDIVTHVGGEPVATIEEVETEILNVLQSGAVEPTILVVVNADQETATALRERAAKMKHALKQR